MLVPRPPEWDDFITADRAFFASQGGDVSIGVRLPAMMEAAGLRVTGIEQTTKDGSSGVADLELGHQLRDVGHRSLSAPSPLVTAKSHA